jgi:hypothetical protein
MEDKTIFVVYCDQAYASFFYVVGVYSTREKAQEIADRSSDYRIEEFTVDKKPSV